MRLRSGIGVLQTKRPPEGGQWDLLSLMETPDAGGRRAQFQLWIFSYHVFRNFASEKVRNAVKSHHDALRHARESGHPRLAALRRKKTWMAGTSPAMTKIPEQRRMRQDAFA
jgi:hypothetical protein